MNKFFTNLCILITLTIFCLAFIFTNEHTDYSKVRPIGVVSQAQSLFDTSDKVTFRNDKESKVYKVTQNKITDGDTFQLHRGSSQFTVRLACVDTPEISQAYGREVKYFLEDIFASYDNNVTFDDLGKDSFGRTIAMVYLPTGESINEVLVRNGWAFPYDKYKDNCPIWHKITIAQSIATKHDLNLFGLNTLRPWIYRKLRKSSSLY